MSVVAAFVVGVTVAIAVIGFVAVHVYLSFPESKSRVSETSAEDPRGDDR